MAIRAHISNSIEVMPIKAAATVLVVSLMALLSLCVPQFTVFRQMLPDLRRLAFAGPATRTESIAPAMPESEVVIRAEAAATARAQQGTEVSAIEDQAHALDRFYKSLSETDGRKPGAITRVVHYGDSPITNDGITSTVRRELQKRFGDAGHGFILIDRPWAWYDHADISFTPGPGWSSEPMGPRSSPAPFGLGGVIARSSAAGAHTSIGTVDKGETGGSASHLEIFYLSQPGGGSIRVTVNKEQVETVTTASETTHSGFFNVRAPSPGRNNFEISASNGPVSLFGAALENDGPGVVYDSLGVNGAYGGLLATAMDEQHWSEQLRHRNPGLVILNYGTNESQYGGEDQIKRYEAHLREVIRRVREALPDVSILILAPMDRGQLAAGGKVITKPAIPAIVEMQQRVAAETGCAFFNTYEAMGGEGTMARWHEAKKPQVRTDLTHPTAEGAEIVGRLISTAILDGYANYKRAH